jgi:hypothetical protein
MKKNEVVLGARYIVKVSGKEQVVKLTAESPYGGWDGLNVETNRRVRIKSAARLRRFADEHMRREVARKTAPAVTPFDKLVAEVKALPASDARDRVLEQAGYWLDGTWAARSCGLRWQHPMTAMRVLLARHANPTAAAPHPTIPEQAAERAALIAALGWKAEDPREGADGRYVATTAELQDSLRTKLARRPVREEVPSEELVIEYDVEGVCSVCGGPNMVLGQLGSKTHYRCRNCGMDSSN